MRYMQCQKNCSYVKKGYVRECVRAVLHALEDVCACRIA